MTSRVLIPILSGLEQNDKPLVKQVLKGVKNIQHQEINHSSHNTTQTSFSFQPPSQNTIIDRQFILSCPVAVRASGTVVFDDANAGGEYDVATNGFAKTSTQTYKFKRASYTAPLRKQHPALVAVDGADVAALKLSVNTNIQTVLNANRGAQTPAQVSRGAVNYVGNNFTPNQFPLNNAIDSIDLTINGTHFSVSVNQYIDAVMRYTTPEYREKFLDMCPHHPNITPNYSSNLTSNCSALGLAGDRGRKGESPRGCWLEHPYCKVSADKKNMVFTLREPLFISPLMASLGHGLTNINNIDIVVRWSSNLKARMFSLIETVQVGDVGNSYLAADGTTVTSLTAAAISVDFNQLDTANGVGQAKLELNYYEAQDDVKIPNEIILPYKQPQINIVQTENINFKTDGEVETAGKIVGNNVRLNQIPDSVYIYAVPKRNDVNDIITKARGYARIMGIKLQWKNQSNILSGFNEDQLIAMARDNGLDAEKEEITRAKDEGEGLGLVLKLVFGKDIPLDDNESSGTRGDYNWRCDVDLSVGGYSGKYELYQVFVMNGHAIISPNECRVATGVLDLKDNLDAQDMGHEHGTGAHLVGGSIIGGSEVGGGLKDIFGHLRHIAKVGAPIAKNLMKNVGPAVAQAVQQYKSRV